MLVLKNISKKYENLDVIDSFDLSLSRGGFTTLIGPSGCGKSTLFDILMGLSKRNTGEITWKGQTLSDLSGHAALMHQKDLLLPWLSLLENAVLPHMILGRDRERAVMKARKLFKRLSLSGFEEYLPEMVSGGMRQRCALARTLMTEHELILMDEPLSSLDALTRQQLHSHILRLQQEFGKTILMITHDIEEALLLSDEVIVLSERPMRVRRHVPLGTPKPRNFGGKDMIDLRKTVFSSLQESMG